MPELKTDKDAEIINKFKLDLKNCADNWQQFYQIAEDDMKMYLGDQKTENQKRQERAGKPAMVINVLKKTVDVMVGHQMQNKTDIRVFPVEGEDSSLCDVYTEAIKWAMVKTKGNRYISQAFKNCNITGIGWVACEMDFGGDVINGNIKIRSENPFRIM